MKNSIKEGSYKPNINGESRRVFFRMGSLMGPAGIILGRQIVDIAIASPLIVN
jgi:hypothetical protein